MRVRARPPRAREAAIAAYFVVVTNFRIRRHKVRHEAD